MYNLIHKNDDFIVIEKNPGVDFHQGADGQESLISFIRKEERFPSLLPVHRLDRMTSGVMLFAGNKTVARELSGMFQQRQIEKYYLALSDKKPKKTQGLIIGDMEKGRGGAWKLLRSRNNPASTRFFSKAYGDGLRLFILKPFTGKTHQLRVALKSMGSPVLGDPVYCRSESGKHDRGYLHSYVLRFQFQGRPYCFSSKPEQGIFFNDPRFEAAFELFREPWLLNWPG